MDDMLRVGVIANTHGIKGEVKVYPTTDDIDRFRSLKYVAVDTGSKQIELEVESVRFFKQMVILKFKGIDSINDIEKWKGKDLLVTREYAVPLKEDEYFICDIIGADVVDEQDKRLGIVSEVLSTGANDVYVVAMDDGREVLLPVIKDCVQLVDTEQKLVRVHLLDGLLDD